MRHYLEGDNGLDRQSRKNGLVTKRTCQVNKAICARSGLIASFPERHSPEKEQPDGFNVL